ncbi:hypothetical protein NIES4071_45840 [Calothrix sp. NIES-4071]|nr:hypothetical protein NIES4071_45840 [Calothrix sp. NIES-4071]BAZ58896.1 hypothetical protein NIES4105_45770 [Calothrix sp. NIES-4105]
MKKLKISQLEIKTVNLIKKIHNQVLKHIHTIPSIQKRGECVYQEALQQHLINLPILSPVDLKLVEALKNEGVAITSLEELVIASSSNMLAATKKIMPLIPCAVKRNEYVVHATNEQMMEYPEIFLWGLERRILNIAETYFGLPVAYHGAYLRRDIANNVQRKSRLWHMDTEDRQVLKAIIYLHDVNEQQGPFQYIPMAVTQKLVQTLKYKQGYIQDSVMQHTASLSDCKSCLGVVGTVIFAATGSIFHRGKIPVASDRLALFFDYTSRLPKYPFFNHYSLPQEYLLSLSKKITKHQLKSLLWQDYHVK